MRVFVYVENGKLIYIFANKFRTMRYINSTSDSWMSLLDTFKIRTWEGCREFCHFAHIYTNN